MLVTTLTTPAFEAVMPVAGAVVTEVGGLMSHTAICCREYGIPAVVRSPAPPPTSPTARWSPSIPRPAT